MHVSNTQRQQRQQISLHAKQEKLDDTCLIVKRGFSTMQNVATAKREDYIKMKWGVADKGADLGEADDDGTSSQECADDRA